MVNMLLLTQHQVVHAGIWSEKTSSYILLGKAGIEGWGNFDNIWGVYFFIGPAMLKIVPPYPGLWITLLKKSACYYQCTFYYIWCIEKFKGKIIHIIVCIFIHSSFCLFYFLLTCRPNFVKFSCIMTMPVFDLIHSYSYSFIFIYTEMAFLST